MFMKIAFMAILLSALGAGGCGGKNGADGDADEMDGIEEIDEGGDVDVVEDVVEEGDAEDLEEADMPSGPAIRGLRPVIGGLLSGSVVAFRYELTSPESAEAGIEVSWSDDGGVSFNAATDGIGGDGRTGLGSSPGGDLHYWAWQSNADLAGGPNDRVVLRLEANWPDDETAAAETALLLVDNSLNAKPFVEFELPSGTLSGSVSIPYRLFDAESEPCSLLVQVDTGEGWKTAMVGDDLMLSQLESSPEGVSHDFVWYSPGNVEGSAPGVRFRFMPSDFVGAATDAITISTPFPVDNTTLPPGNVYWVDQHHAAADDANAGSRDEPWMTVQRGVQDLNPGDTLFIKAGVYRESVTYTRNGAPGQPITIAGAPGEHVVISGSKVVTGWTEHEVVSWEPPAPGALTTITDWSPGDGVGFPLVEAELTGSFVPVASLARPGIEHQEHLLVDGRLIPRVFAYEDMQEGTWFLDEANGHICLWPPGGEDVRRVVVQLFRQAPAPGSPVTIYRADYPWVLPDELEGPPEWTGHRGMAFREMLFVDDVRLQRVFSALELQEGTYYLDETAQEVLLWPPQSTSIDGRLVEAAAEEQLFRMPNFRTDLFLRNIEFKHAANQRSANAVVINSKRALIEDIRVHDCRAKGFTLGGNFPNSLNLLRNSRFDHMGQMGIVGAQTDSVVEDCELDHNNWAYQAGWETGGSKHVYSYNLTYRRVVAHHNKGPGIWYDVFPEGCRILECVAYENLKHGIFYEISGTGEIADNLSFGNYTWDPDYPEQAAGGVGLRRSPDVRIHHNLLVGNVQGIFASPWNGDDPVFDMVRNEWTYNILTQNTRANLAMMGPESIDPAGGNSIHHNIYDLERPPDPESVSGCPYQILWGTGWTALNPATAYRSLEEFYADVPDQAAGSLESEILLGDPGLGDYRVLFPGLSDRMHAGPRQPIEVGGFVFGVSVE